ncbi:MAG: HTH-type transcriptional regulator MhqR [Syntrophaceae bacterium PtaU1.Bin231]|nr:MAG: HTH-type transcriptional regulator MhqR [Syntrophaceae bacterium PtaU1.Bin231]
MGTHHQGTESERRALDAYIKLMRAAESVTLAVLPRLAEAGLTAGQFGVLEALMHLGPLPQHELASKLLRSSGNTSVVLANLERAGLVQRRRRHEDRRVQVVSLTPRGHQLIAEIFPRHAAVLARRMGVLNAAELEALGALCRKLGRGAESSRSSEEEAAARSGSQGAGAPRQPLTMVMSPRARGGYR